MKQQRITLRRDNGMLRTQVYATGAYEHSGRIGPDFGLCDYDLQAYFDIPRSCMEIDLVLSTRKSADSYAVRQIDECYIEGRDPEDIVWVDNEFATMIGVYAAAAKQEYVYVSFEFPKEKK